MNKTPELPTGNAAEIVTEVHGHVGLITLNRPKAQFSIFKRYSPCR